MEKLAQLKNAEVCGVLSALVDKGLLPVNSPTQFEKVATYVSTAIDGYNYTLVNLLSAAEEAMKKMAEDSDVADVVDDDKEKPVKNKRDLVAGIGAGVGAVTGFKSGIDGLNYLYRSGWVRSPKSKLAKALLGLGAGAFVGHGVARAGQDTARDIYDFVQKKKKAKE